MTYVSNKWITYVLIESISDIASLSSNFDTNSLFVSWLEFVLDKEPISDAASSKSNSDSDSKLASDTKCWWCILLAHTKFCGSPIIFPNCLQLTKSRNFSLAKNWVIYYIILGKVNKNCLRETWFNNLLLDCEFNKLHPFVCTTCIHGRSLGISRKLQQWITRFFNFRNILAISGRVVMLLE